MIPDALRTPPGGKPWLLSGLLGASALFNLALFVAWGSGPTETVVAPTVQAIGEDTTVSNPAVPPDQVPPLPRAQGVGQTPGTEVFSGVVTRSLSATFQEAVVESPAALSAVYTRLFAWDVDMRRDLHKGDVVDVLYEQPDNAEPLVIAARLHLNPGSGKETTFAAYRFQAPGDAYPSYWDKTGQEVPRRLIDGPVVDYEQITSLLKDRPTHKGMDFKTNIGTPILTPRAGVVTRTNWNHAANGNCVEVRFTDGVLAKFLHLNENTVKEGQRLTAGAEVGKSGNTGHSTGPHLHYQIERGSTVLDPIAYHGTLRRQLQPEAMESFVARVAEFEAQLEGRVATR